jgi:hypothetical protein
MAGLRPLLPLLLLGVAGCVGFRYERRIVGTARPVVEARRLETGKTTFRETLARLGPPDLLLRVGHVDRAYWMAWDGDSFKFDVALSLRNVSWDAFILGLGSEDLRMARLEFDRQGVLLTAQIADFESSRAGQYIAIDDRIVSTFMEDRERFLHLLETDDDDEDVELDKR